MTAWSSVETEARRAYGRLVALLASRSGDLASAEDALGDALLAALERWPSTGIPANPQAWLLTVARRRGIDRVRRRTHADGARVQLSLMQEEAEAAMNEEAAFPDKRLGLLIACAHPAIDAGARTPLMLQAVLGLTVERMASAFLTSPAAMTKRLVRAKAKLAGAGVRFETPGLEALADRLEPVLDAVYAAFTLARAGEGDGDLRHEAVWLGRLLAELTPGEPEPGGLLALMLFISARPSPVQAGRFIPLSHQEPSCWNAPLIEEAEARLRQVGRYGRPGRFQLEAAIQAVHANRRRHGRTDWAVILDLYDSLLALTPTIGSRVARAAALAQSGDASAALRDLNGLDPARVASHQPYWATRAYTLAAVGEQAEAADAYGCAAALAEHPAIRAWLLEQRALLDNWAVCPKRHLPGVTPSNVEEITMTAVQVIGLPQSNFVWATRIALAEKGVAHENVPSPPHSPDVLAVHPLGKIPVLRHGSVALGESRAIIDYVDKAFDGPSLVPEDPEAARRNDSWTSIVATAVEHTLIRQYALAYLVQAGPGGEPDRAAINAMLPKVEAVLDALETAMDAGELGGEPFGRVDAYLVPILFYTRMFPEGGTLIAARPQLSSYLDRALSRPSVQATMPPPPAA